MLLNILLILFLSYLVAALTWKVVGQGEYAVAPVVTDLLHIQPGAADNAPSLSELAQMNLFGEAVSTAGDHDIEEVIDAPETRLNLQLKGVFSIGRSEAAMAIIAASGRDDQSYRVGDKVAGAAIVHKIMPDRVILKRGERFETLTLPTERLDGLSTDSGNMSRSSSGTSATVRTLSGVRDRLLKDPQQALKMVRAEPVMEAGRVKGYRVSPGRERALFARSGLRPGDVVTQINGITLGDSSRFGELMQMFRDGARMNVTVERAGRPVNLSLELR